MALLMDVWGLSGGSPEESPEKSPQGSGEGSPSGGKTVKQWLKMAFWWLSGGSSGGKTVKLSSKIALRYQNCATVAQKSWAPGGHGHGSQGAHCSPVTDVLREQRLPQIIRNWELSGNKNY